jgi:hypothetical protein
MSVTVNLRNNTDLWVKVDGIDETIAPNTVLEDKTHQWISTDNKSIRFFSTVNCDGAPILTSTLTFHENVGIKVNRGNLEGAQIVRLDADCGSNRILQEENGVEEILIEWSQITPDCEVNLSFNK